MRPPARGPAASASFSRAKFRARARRHRAAFSARAAPSSCPTARGWFQRSAKPRPVTGRPASVTTLSSEAPRDPARTVLVAGGLGFVGSHVVRALVNAGYFPVLLGPDMAEDRLVDIAGRYDRIEGSIADRAGLAAAFARFKPSLVVSCVAHSVGNLGLMRSGETESDAAFEINVAGHGKLIEAACAAGVRRIVWTSSTVVYGPASDYADTRVDEDDRPAPTTIYGLTKQMAEALSVFLARRHGIDIVGLRLPLILGHGLWYQGAASAIVDIFAAARAGRVARVAFHDRPVDLM